MQIIQNYIQTLMVNLPNLNPTQKEPIDIILDGGLFNGSYLIGALLFLKEMEKQNHVQIDRISSCSVGSICAIVYFLDALDLFPEIYSMFLKQFKEQKNLNVFDQCFDKIRQRITCPKEFCKRIHNRVYIAYYDIVKRKKIVKKKFATLEDVFEAVRRSCFVPFIINGNCLYKDRFFDGITPYVFPKNKSRAGLQSAEKKALYLDLLGWDKINYMLSVKNEKTNIHRVLAGLLDIHLFFIKKKCTYMCSYTDQWSLYGFFHKEILKRLFENIIFYLVYVIYLLQQYIPIEVYKTSIFKTVSKIIKKFYMHSIKTYCF
jgi:hypothetical protein